MTMTQEEIQNFKGKLESEKSRLISELEGIAVQDPENPNNWNVKNPEMNDRETDPNDLGDNLEEEGNNDGITNALEVELKDVNDALVKIEEGRYGKCDKCDSDIEKERLEANTSARTCIGCMNL